MKGRIWILLVIVLLVVVWMYKSYREPLTDMSSASSATTKPPQTIPIPPVISKIDKCDYPLAIQSVRIFASDQDIAKGVQEISKITSNLCSSSNPINITNQAEVCGYITDLSSAYSGKIMDTCPNATYDGDKLNQASVCKLPAYLASFRQAITDAKAAKQIPAEVDENKGQQQMLKALADKCSQGNRNACIIGNALIGNLPTYCSMTSTSSPPPSIPPGVAAGATTF